MNQGETVYIIGESRTNLDNAITKVYGTFYIAFEIIPETEEIIEVDCSRTLELTKDFIRRLFIGKKFVTDAEQIEAEVKRSAGWRIRSAAYAAPTASARVTFSPSPHVSLFPWKRQTGSGLPRPGEY